VGKTSLALEAAYRCLQDVKASPFNAVIFTSAQPGHFTLRGVLPRRWQQRTLAQIVRTVTIVLDCPGILKEDLETQIEQLHLHLSRQRVLLIVDNLDGIDQQQEILSFLYELPTTVKVVMTSREQAITDLPIRLDPLPPDDSLALIACQAKTKLVSLGPAQAQVLCAKTGGMPAAIEYALGQLTSGYLFEEMLPRLMIPENDFCRFYLGGSVQPLRRQLAHRLLMALAMFPRPALREAIVAVAEPGAEVADAFAQLQQLSLVTFRDGRYDLLPLTREYVLGELEADPVFEQEARQRWIGWHLQLVAQWGTENWRQWRDYTVSDQEWGNVEAVINWCIEQQRYQAFGQFWQQVRGYTHLWGYWQERLEWMQWWCQAAAERLDQANRVQALRDRAWTLALIGNPQQLTEAEALLSEAWGARDKLKTEDQFELAIEQAILALYQVVPNTVENWLETARQLLELTTCEGSQRLRQRIRVDYYEGWRCYQKQNYSQAKERYQRVLDLARSIQWQQMEVYTLNWLADIALAEENPVEAEHFLSFGLPIVEAYRDQRSIAFHACSWAKLERLRGNEAECQGWATQAQAIFAKLGMEVEVERMRSWLLKERLCNE
jgi:LuxR family glucitol operon transcriptional activator